MLAHFYFPEVTEQWLTCKVMVVFTEAILNEAIRINLN